MRLPLVVLLACGLGFAGAAVACSSSSSSAAGSPDASADGASSGARDAGPDIIIDPQNCVAPGTPNNAQGVGGYCSPGGGQCALPDGATTICTADFGSIVPPHAWFCTNICSLDGGATNVCGASGSPCTGDPEGYPVCLPAACHSFLAALGDGGTPADGAKE